jgi:hypothetical protein
MMQAAIAEQLAPIGAELRALDARVERVESALKALGTDVVERSDAISAELAMLNEELRKRKKSWF